PSGLIPFIRAVNPSARILYRSHIQVRAELTDHPGTAQARTWAFLWENIRHAAAFVSHPLEQFVPAVVPREKVAFMPATTDALDGLNKPLSEGRRARLMAAFDRRLESMGQTALDPERPYMVQIARFDPSKGIDTVLAGYALLRERLRREGVPDARAPQLVFAGHGAVDDAEGGEVFQRTLQAVRTLYPEWAGDIKAASLPHSDQVLDAVARGALFGLQLSDAEGFEIKVTEELMKGVPVIGSLTGGIPLQIEHERTGLLIAPKDPMAAAAAMHRLWGDAAYRDRLSRAASSRRPRLLTQHNLLRWLRLARGASPD
ncbi:MAG: glycosyltransferase, partial [Elusimicrobia bacterium]|nr:glycosyltransferase [Elusimicrobiota bacterium]